MPLRCNNCHLESRRQLQRIAEATLAKKKKRGGDSLRDQLRAAGLVTAKQARRAESASHRQEVRQKQGGEADVSKLEVQQAQAAKRAADRDRNAALNQAAQEKAISAQVRQLVTSNSQREQGDVAYNFTDGKRVKRIHISETNRQQLNKGHLAIVRLGDAYDLVPEPVARKIMERSEADVLYLADRSQDVVDEDDPYKDFPIPDDLDW
ncbi:MAG: nucleoprotein/polynucleotide-associated enzyme [Gammaproteobacteria bacterium]|jgi:uncharacterized protein YaiL (DUF2058 family)|nr:nucleoprotein/polynucleotide-associated enzyme [Gammaproteobacteria bacterium]